MSLRLTTIIGPWNTTYDIRVQVSNWEVLFALHWALHYLVAPSHPVPLLFSLFVFSGSFHLSHQSPTFGPNTQGPSLIASLGRVNLGSTGLVGGSNPSNGEGKCIAFAKQAKKNSIVEGTSSGNEPLLGSFRGICRAVRAVRVSIGLPILWGSMPASLSFLWGFLFS